MPVGGSDLGDAAVAVDQASPTDSALDAAKSQDMVGAPDLAMSLGDLVMTVTDLAVSWPDLAISPPDQAVNLPPDQAMNPPPDQAISPPPDQAMNPPPDQAMNPPDLATIPDLASSPDLSLNGCFTFDGQSAANSDVESTNYMPVGWMELRDFDPTGTAGLVTYQQDPNPPTLGTKNDGAVVTNSDGATRIEVTLRAVSLGNGADAMVLLHQNFAQGYKMYTAMFNGTQLNLERFNNSPTYVKTVPFTLNVGQSYRVRFEVRDINGKQEGKITVDGQVQIDWIDTGAVFPSGRAGVLSLKSHIHYDDICVQ